MHIEKRCDKTLGMLILAAVFLISSSSFAETVSQQEIEEVLKTKIKDISLLAQYPLVVKAVQEQNAKNMTLEEIQQIDTEWKRTTELTPFKKSLQTGDAAEFLKKMIRRKNVSSEKFNEVFLTDRQGANVIAFPATSDYWQGDEAKWKEAYNDGKGEIYIGPAEFDESTDSYAVQISAPVLDNGKAIGVLTVGVRLRYIKAKILKKQKRRN